MSRAFVSKGREAPGQVVGQTRPDAPPLGRHTSVLLALTSAHDGFFEGVARYAREQQWHLVTDLIYTGKIPQGWRGAGIISLMGDRADVAQFILSSGLPAVELSLARQKPGLPSLETKNNLHGMGYQAAVLLDGLMAGKRPPQDLLRVRPWGGVARRRTDIGTRNPPPEKVANPQVALASRFIQEHHTNPRLRVPDVVASTNLSRRSLELAFRHELQRTLKEEIVRLRVNTAKHLLATTHRPVLEIGAAAGFFRSHMFFRTFRSIVGLTPKAYRASRAARDRPARARSSKTTDVSPCA